MYTEPMDVAVSALRAELAQWIERAQSGEEVVITDRGTPVARLVGIDSAPLLEQLTSAGVLGRPQRPDRPSAQAAKRVAARRPVSELIDRQRD